MTETVLKNQAIATIPGTLAAGRFTLPDGRQPRTFIHPRVKGWLSRQMLPLQLETNFRCWPRYNRDGLKSITVVGVAPTEHSGIVAGKVIKADGERLTVLVKPQSERVPPFHVQLTRGDAPEPKRGDLCRFEVVWKDGGLVVTDWCSLQQGKPPAQPAVTPPRPTPSASAAPVPEAKPVDEAEQMARTNYQALMAQAQAAADPRVKQQFETLAAAVLANYPGRSW